VSLFENFMLFLYFVVRQTPAAPRRDLAGARGSSGATL